MAQIRINTEHTREAGQRLIAEGMGWMEFETGGR